MSTHFDRKNVPGLYPIDGSSIGRCRCKCAHARLQKHVTLLSFVVSVIAVFVAVYAVCANRVADSQQSCGLSDEDRRLLEELRSLSLTFNSHAENEIPNEIREPLSDQSEVNPILIHRVKRGQSSKKKKAKGKKDKKKRKKKHVILAGHYVPDFWGDRQEHEYKEEKMCINVEKWGGQACRNRTLIMKKGPMTFFHEADWVKENANIRSPVKQHKNGTFEVEESGLYLLYSSVLFYDSKRKQSQAIVKNGTRLFKCMEGVDYISNDDPNKLHYSKYKTCSVTGVTYLKKGELLWVGNLYDNTIIEMSPDSTFFGLVQLVAERKKRKKG